MDQVFLMAFTCACFYNQFLSIILKYVEWSIIRVKYYLRWNLGSKVKITFEISLITYKVLVYSLSIRPTQPIFLSLQKRIAISLSGQQMK